MPLCRHSTSDAPSSSPRAGREIVRLSRYRAALQAARAAGRGTMVVSHLPRMSAATAAAMRVFGRTNPHLAFSFNFTDLPQGKGLAYMRSVLRSVDRFAIYSNFERQWYAELFGIDSARFVPVMWTQSVPAIDGDHGPAIEGQYYCAIGAEGRDFDLLLDVARTLPKSLKIVVIARPQSLGGRSLPDNIVFMSNISLARVWAIAKESLGVLIPLRSAETCCGHITFVSAKQLGIPVAATRSHATVEYTEGRPAILESDARDVPGFARSLERLVDEQEVLRRDAQARRADEIALHHRSKWADYLSDFIDDHFAKR